MNKASSQMARSTAKDLQIYEGTLLGNYYRVESFLGEGSFGLVAQCRHIETNKAVAIKVNRNQDYQTLYQTKQEIEILKQLQCLDPDTCNIAKWNGFFFHLENICLNFELLDQSLYSYMESRNFQGLTVTEITPIIHQLATALSHLSSKGIVHADIKPENIMLVDRKQQPLKVKLIDFGLALPVADVEPGVCVGTLWYMAPEVMLGFPFTEAVDMWSLGTTVAELVTGCPLYPGNTYYDILRFIIRAQGQPPDHVLDRCLHTKNFFKRQNNGQKHWKLKTWNTYAYETGCHVTDTSFTVRSLDDLEHLMVKENGDESDRRLLVDLIKRMLHLDPDQRIKPLEVLQHRFLTGSVPQRSCADICIHMPDEEEETAEVSKVLSRNQTPGQENINCRVKITTDSLPVVQPETNAENKSWLGRLVTWIKDTVYYYVPLCGFAATQQLSLANPGRCPSLSLDLSFQSHPNTYPPLTYY